MKKLNLLILMIVLHGSIVPVNGQNSSPCSITIEYINLFGLGKSIPDIQITEAEMIPIMKGDAPLFIFVKNAPPEFKKLGKIKRDKRFTTNDITAFNVTEYIISRYRSKKISDINIKGPNNNYNKIKIDNSLNKHTTNDWDQQ